MKEKNNITLEEALQKIASLESQVLTMRESINKRRTFRPEAFIKNHEEDLRVVQSQHYTNLGTLIRLILFPNAIRPTCKSSKPGYTGMAAITVKQLSDRQFSFYMKTYEKVLELIIDEASEAREQGFDGFDTIQ